MPARRRNLWQIGDTGNSKEVGTARIGAYNQIYQSELADLTNMSLIAIVKEIDEGGLPAKVVLTVYDQILLELEERDLNEVAGYAQEIMEGWTRKWRLPMHADMEAGVSWGALEDFKLPA